MGNYKIFKRLQNNIIYAFFVVTFISSTGYASNNRSYDKQIQFSNNWMREFTKIKDPSLYKPLIEKEIKYFQDPSFSDEGTKHLKAAKLKLAYARLFVIENAIGNKYQADIYFEKSRYWNLIDLECFSSASAKEKIENLATITKKNMKIFIAKLNPEFYKKVQGLAKK